MWRERQPTSNNLREQPPPLLLPKEEPKQHHHKPKHKSKHQQSKHEQHPQRKGRDTRRENNDLRTTGNRANSKQSRGSHEAPDADTNMLDRPPALDRSQPYTERTETDLHQPRPIDDDMCEETRNVLEPVPVPL